MKLFTTTIVNNNSEMLSEIETKVFLSSQKALDYLKNKEDELIKDFRETYDTYSDKEFEELILEYQMDDIETEEHKYKSYVDYQGNEYIYIMNCHELESI